MVSTKMWMRKTWWCKVVDPQTLVIPQCGSTKLPYSDIITFCGRTNLHGTVLWIHTCASSVFVHPQKCKFQPWIYRPDPKKIRGNAAQFFPGPFELWVSKIAKPEIPRLANLENQATGSFFSTSQSLIFQVHYDSQSLILYLEHLRIHLLEAYFNMENHS